MISSPAHHSLMLLSALPLLATAGLVQPRADAVNWVACGEGFQCANVSVPLDHNNSSDTRQMSIPLTRFSATDKANRKGSVFINPGGPGESGTQWAYTSGAALSAVLDGQYDIIGFDPRGINTVPYVSCFNSQLEQEAFMVRTNNFLFNLPGNVSAFSSSIEANLRYQVSQITSEVSSLAAHCYERTGDALSFIGTEAVVKDIDYISKMIEGDDVPVNFWGISYGTVIGQYMAKILPPARLGKIIIDGVVNVNDWSDYAIDAYKKYDLNMAASFRGFASACLAAKQNCTLNAFNFTTPGELLGAVDNVVDALYAEPAPVYDLAFPATATAADLRFFLGYTMYSIERWPLLADGLALALTGNFTPIVGLLKPWVNGTDAGVPDSSFFGQHVIFCDDTKPYDDARPAPTTSEVTQAILGKVQDSPNWANNWISHLIFCHAWGKAKLTPPRSRYEGTFEMANNTLKTPVLILSNTVDNATPLAGAKSALEWLGSNGRLIQQKDAYGHCSISVVSFCTLAAIREYMLNGTVPGEALTMCSVDQQPFVESPVQPILTKRGRSSDEAAKAAWSQVSKTMPQFGRRM